MLGELEYDYPSEEFFSQIETILLQLSISSRNQASRIIARSGSEVLVQNLVDLLTRLKVNIGRDFQKNEDEYESVPYVAKYILIVESEKSCNYLSVKTALISKYDHPGRVLYGPSIFRVDQNLYITESHDE
jgi:hypothetical protein